MGRFEPTGPVDVADLAHSVAELSWGVLRGACGPSDGTAGASSNVPSALGVIRHARIYAHLPDEIEEAFAVLENHVVRDAVVYPVALAVVPFLFDTLRRSSPVAGRIAGVIARYASAMDSLEPALAMRFQRILSDHSSELARWLGEHDRALCAITLRVPALRDVFIAAVEGAERVSAEVFLALIELDEAPGYTRELAYVMFESPDATVEMRMCAAMFLAKFGQLTPELCTDIDAVLPPSTDIVLHEFVDALWKPTIVRPRLAPTLFDAEVTFAGRALVVVQAGHHTAALPWAGAPVTKGDRLQVGLTTHGEPKLAVHTDSSGRVNVIDFESAAAPVR